MDSEQVEFDDILPHVGAFGKYQWLLFLGLAPFCVNLVFLYFVQFFITLLPDHWCAVPLLIDANVSVDVRRSLAVPTTRDSLGVETSQRCLVYDVDYGTLLQEGVTRPNASWPVKECERWEYDTSGGNYHTIVSELGWVCGREWYATLAQSVFFLGAIVGGAVTGWAADRYGRVPVLVVTNLIGAFSHLLTAVSTSLADFLVYRFMAGLAFDNIFVIMYVLVLEYIGPKHRTIVANLSIALFYTAGTVALPWLAVGVGNWRLLSVISAIPMILAALCYWCLPESARWLMLQGRVDETVEILQSIAKVNNQTIPENMIEQFKRSAAQEDQMRKGVDGEWTISEDNRTKEEFKTGVAQEDQMKKDLEGERTSNEDNRTREDKVGRDLTPSVFDLFRTPRLRFTTIAISVLWMLLNLVYDGHARNVSHLPLNVFVGFSIASATELPADLFLILTLDRWGRRWLACGTLMLSGLLTILTTAVSGNPVGVAVLAILGRLCVNITYNIGLQYAAELLPTVVRAQGVAAVHIAGYLAALLSPVVVYLGSINPLIPLVILGVASVIGGCVALLLPETLHRDLPQTLADGEAFGKDQSFCYFPCLVQDTKSSNHLTVVEVGQQPSFIRHPLQPRPSLRGETYRSSLIRHRKEVIYLPVKE